MNQEWCCTSTVIAQTTIVFIISTYNLLKTHILYCIKVAMTLVITFAGEVLFERKPPTSIKPEATPGERVDLRISGQPKVPHTKNENAEKAFFQFDPTSLIFSNQIDNDCRFDQQLCTDQERRRRILSCVTS